jgi:zinc/manganese transport system substrate-binding protein
MYHYIKCVILIFSAIGFHLSAEAKLKITTSILPITAHTMSLCGDLAEVRQLIPPTVGLHDFNPRPSDLKRLQEADLIIINGIGLEPWIENWVKASDRKNKIVDASVGIKPIDDNEMALEGCSHEHEEEGDHHHHHGPNPHVWLDPVLAKQQVQNILKALIQADPANQKQYESNAKNYLKRLEDLHKKFQETLASLRKKSLLTFHNSFPYFAKRYGINYLGYVEQLPDQSPSPKRVARIVKIIQEHKADVIFTEVGYSPKLIQTLARESGARIASLDTLEVGTPASDAYIEAMQRNLQVLKDAWR